MRTGQRELPEARLWVNTTATSLIKLAIQVLESTETRSRDFISCLFRPTACIKLCDEACPPPCPKPCDNITAPICALCDGKKVTFQNQCQLDNANCKNPNSEYNGPLPHIPIGILGSPFTRQYQRAVRNSVLSFKLTNLSNLFYIQSN